MTLLDDIDACDAPAEAKAAVPDIQPHELERLAAFRVRAFDAIRRALAADDHCKAYEGAVSVAFPSYFAGQGGGFLYQPQDCFEVRLSCYVIGPGRHYVWIGNTLGEALDAAERDFAGWVRELEDEEREAQGVKGGGDV